MAACPRPLKAAILGQKPRTPHYHLWLEDNSPRKKVARGSFLFRPGDPADALYMLEEGLVKVSVCSHSGRDLTVGLYGPGELFGEEAVLEEGRRVAFATALEPTVLLVMPRERLHHLLERDPQTAALLMHLLATRVKDSIRQLESIAWNPVPSRLAGALLRLSDRNGVSDGDRKGLHPRITHQELANLIGSTRETTTATLNDFRRQGWIAIARRRVILLRPDLLAALAVGHHD